jgi:hypothetical protein
MMKIVSQVRKSWRRVAWFCSDLRHAVRIAANVQDRHPRDPFSLLFVNGLLLADVVDYSVHFDGDHLTINGTLLQTTSGEGEVVYNYAVARKEVSVDVVSGATNRRIQMKGEFRRVALIGDLTNGPRVTFEFIGHRRPLE